MQALCEKSSYDWTVPYDLPKWVHHAVAKLEIELALDLN